MNWRQRCVENPDRAVFDGVGPFQISRNSSKYEFLYNRNASFVVRAIKTDRNGRISELMLEAVPNKKKSP